MLLPDSDDQVVFVVKGFANVRIPILNFLVRVALPWRPTKQDDCGMLTTSRPPHCPDQVSFTTRL